VAARHPRREARAPCGDISPRRSMKWRNARDLSKSPLTPAAIEKRTFVPRPQGRNEGASSSGVRQPGAMVDSIAQWAPTSIATRRPDRPCTIWRCYMPEIIRIGTLELRFLLSKHDTNGSLDLFEMTVPPYGRMPVPHYHRDWEETVYGLTGVITLRANRTPHDIRPSQLLSPPGGVVYGFGNRSGAM